ncbi:hypothetical protein HPB47_020560 [Ixodes persulcatus]|uniref:Uncharacterized protein n=1 Tax=Ixodes persulcatus TaxID=34615 RepID=A0AC60QIM9_IXOPE|nr:hypothetical protein HPB47_020560 [Ixodes persulcatus]
MRIRFATHRLNSGSFSVTVHDGARLEEDFESFRKVSPGANTFVESAVARAKSSKDCAQDGKPKVLNGFPDFFGERGVKTTEYSKLDNKVRFLAEWLGRGNFVLGAHIQGGLKDLIVAYGFHNSAEDGLVTPTPDDDILRHLSKRYASRHPKIKKGTPECSGGHLGGFPEGITPAAAWKRRPGLMEDYAYAKEGVLELVLAVSCCAVPAETRLRELWDENRDALLAFLSEAQRGIRGYIKGPGGAHIPGALLTIVGRNVAFRSSDQGEFWRILLPGSYLLLVTANGFLPTAVRATVPEVAEHGDPLVITMSPCFRPVEILPMDSYTTEETASRRRGDGSTADAVRAIHFAVLVAWAVAFIFT